MNMGLFGDIMKLFGVGTGWRKQRKLMREQDKINDENYERERQDKIEDYQRTLNDQKLMIEDERQYNSIGSVMQRARDANVSPLAALGVSSGNTLASVSPPQGTSSQGVSIPTSPTQNSEFDVLGALTSIEGVKNKRKELRIEKERADADNALKREQERKTEVERLLLEIEKSFKDDQEKARLKGMLADNDIKGVEKALKEQEHQQKEEMFPLEKRESESRTKLNEAHAHKATFEDWYQRTHHRTLSNGLSHFIDVLMDSVGGKTPVIENAIDEVTDGKGLIKGAKEGLFSFLNKHVPYLSDQALKEYVDVLWDYLKTINFRSLR